MTVAAALRSVEKLAHAALYVTIAAAAVHALPAHAADPSSGIETGDPSTKDAAIKQDTRTKPKPERGFADKPIAKLGGKSITFADIDPATAFQVYRQKVDTYTLLVRAVNDLVERRLLAAEAERRGISPEELNRMLEEEAEPVTPADVDAYLAKNPAAAEEADARERAAYYLTEQRRNQTRLDIVNALRDRANFKMLLMPPEQPRTPVSTAHAPARGPEDAPVVLVHFASFTSKRSAVSAEQIRRLTRELPGRIRWLHRSLPAEEDDVSLASAQLASEAEDKGKFWEVHDRLFELGGAVKATDLERIAEDLDLPPVRPGDTSHLESIKRDADEAKRVGVAEEPVIFVNGRYFGPTFPYVELRALVASEIGEASGDEAARGPAPDQLSDDEP